MKIIVEQDDSSLRICFPADVVRAVALEEGDVVDITARDGEIVLRPLNRKRTLADLFRGKSAEEWRAIYRESAVDWGPDVGGEIIDD